MTTTAPRARVIDALTDEVWSPVVGWETKYEVSDQGQVRSIGRFIDTGNGTWFRPGQLLKPSPNRKGYLTVGLSLSKYKGVSRTVHRLVTDAFIGPLPAGLQTRHLNGDKTDNRLINLVYGTPLENADDTRRHGTLVSANAGKTHCKRGHELAGTNLRMTKQGSRRCRLCDKHHNSARVYVPGRGYVRRST